jgi:cytochrome c biogenesis protein CcmG/thiol:disulfide interchange protein DsbE
MKLRFLLPLLIFGALFATFGFMLYRTESGTYDPKVIQSPLLGKPAPAFRLPNVQDPTQFVDTRDFQGQIYVLNVWGTWCIGCRQEHPALLEIAKEQLVPIVGLDTTGGSTAAEELPNAQRWLMALGNPYAVTAFDADGRVAIDWGVYGAPETFLIDAKGIVNYKYIGPLSTAAWQQEFVPRISKLKASSGEAAR